MSKRGRPRKKKRFDFSLSLFILAALIWGLYLLSSGVTFYKSKTATKTTFFSQKRHEVAINNPKNLNIPILLYHYVEYVKDPKDTIRKSLDILPVVFENQVATLKNAGYTFLTPRDVNLILSNKMKLPQKPIILSFDDGYEDFYTDVLPILKRQNVRAVEYIISGFIDHPNYMTTSELNKVKNSNLVELGCHTVHHPDLAHESSKIANYEISQCHFDLLSKFDINTVSFAYPYGSYNSSLFSMLKNSGFQNATTTKPGSSESDENIYEIPRIRPGGRMGSELLTFLENETRTASAINPAKPQALHE